MARNRRVLWVDDVLKGDRAKRDQKILERDLAAEGIGDTEVVTLQNAADILVGDVAPYLKADLVIFDWSYDDNPGILPEHVLAAFARRDPFVPVIVYTAYQEKVHLDVHGNVRAVVAKPKWRRLIESIKENLMKRSPVVMHLSDLHFGSGHGHGQPRTFQSLWESLEPEFAGFLAGIQPNVVVVSGDLTSQGSRDEFGQAREFLRLLASTLGIPRGNVLVVPGNHDVQLSEKFSYNNYFEWFVEKFYDDDSAALESHLFGSQRVGESMIVQDDLAWVRAPAGVAGTFVGFSSTTVSSESSHLVKGFTRGTVGNIRTSQASNLAARLAHFDPNASIRFAVLHHQLFPMPSRAPGASEDVLLDDDNRVVVGQASLLNWLSENSIQVVLHGHSHYPASRTVSTHYAGRWRQSGIPIHVFGAGATGAAYRPQGFSEHYYGILSIIENSGDSYLEQKTRILPTDGTGWKSAEGMDVRLLVRKKLAAPAL